MNTEYTVATEQELEYEATIARLQAQNRELLAALESALEDIIAIRDRTSGLKDTEGHRAAVARIAMEAEERARAAIAKGTQTK